MHSLRGTIRRTEQNPTAPLQKGRAIHPPLKRLILTHILGKALSKWLYKAEILSISPIQVSLPSPFTKSICKMWVRIRLKRRGFLARHGKKAEPTSKIGFYEERTWPNLFVATCVLICM